jgi:dolichol-phosphate mannosyltransferase
MSPESKSLSVIIPTFNEVEGIEITVLTVLNELKNYDLEIIIVDDGSKDGTEKVLINLSQNIKQLKLIKRISAQSLGGSIGLGIAQASKKYICIIDADLTHNPSYIHQMLSLAVGKNYVVGSRFCAGGSMPNRFHYFASKYFNLFLKVYLNTKVLDNLSGFIIFDKTYFSFPTNNRIFYGYGDYFFRLIKYLNVIGYNPVEVPIVYKNREFGSSKSNFIRLLFKYSWSAITNPLINYKLNHDIKIRKRK